MREYREVAYVWSRLAYPYQCYSVNKCCYDKKQHDCTMCLKWIAGVLILHLEKCKQQKNEKAESSMDCSGVAKFLLTATYRRRTCNCLRLHAILVNIQLKNEHKEIKGISITFYLPTNVFSCNVINAHI